MCGIVGYIGKKNASPILFEGLGKLEYRGYDSAGLAVLSDGKITSIKTVSRVEMLKKDLQKLPKSNLGIAHTRWATHGKPSLINAHPHTDCKGKIWVVHNGIIENYRELRSELEKRGHVFKSETDTEVIAHLIEEFDGGKLEKKVFQALKKIKGTYGLVVISEDEPEKIIVARCASPLLIGVGENEFIIASDASAIIRHTRKVIYLEDGEMAVITPKNYKILDINEQPIDKSWEKIEWNEEQISKGGYKHFMAKEIHETAEAINNSIRGRIIPEKGMVKLGGLEMVKDQLKDIKRIIIIACGTASYAGLVGEYMIEEFAGISVEVEYASEFRYRKSVIDEKTAVLAISQSGETADTLAAIKEAKRKKALTLGIVNVVGSSIARETDAGVYNHIGPEISVASTKAFTSQLVILALFSIFLGRQRSMPQNIAKKILKSIIELPNQVKKIFTEEEKIKAIAQKYKKYKNFLYLARKYNYPLAHEGAIKLKEVSYIHAEGYPTGEMKHGPIAMIDKDFPSVFIVPDDSVYDKVFSGMEEIKARGGKIIAVATSGDKEVAKIADDVIYIPKTIEMLNPILVGVALQLFAYYMAVGLDRDVDKPRNLAKSVTVE